MKQTNKVLICAITLLLGGLFLCSCKRQDIRDELFRNGWSEMDSISDRSFFPPNITTWIYEESTTGELDTVSLVQQHIDTIDVYYSKYPDILHYTKVIKSQRLYSSRFMNITYYGINMHDPFVAKTGTISKSIGFGSYTFAHTPLPEKFKHHTLHGLSGVVDFHSSYSVNGTSYMNVAEIEQLGESGLNGEHTRYFFAPNYGLIKFVNYHQNQVWQLLLVY